VLHELHHERGGERFPGAMTPYLGSTMDMARLEQVLAMGGIAHHRASGGDALCEEVAALLAEGRLVGWVQGSAEFGPRGLGNRSILADPRRAETRERVNERTTEGEFYRPLDPAILVEHCADYFLDYQESPYGERALVFREEVRDKVKAVVHPDGTGRVHTVTAEANPLYHALLTRFHAQTGIPLLATAPLAVRGAPIVHSIDDALASLYTGGLDRLVIGPYVLEK
jgi:carbamoyltransferase